MCIRINKQDQKDLLKLPSYEFLYSDVVTMNVKIQLTSQKYLLTHIVFFLNLILNLNMCCLAGWLGLVNYFLLV